MIRRILELSAPLDRGEESDQYVHLDGVALSFAPRVYSVVGVDGAAYRETFKAEAFKRTIARHTDGFDFHTANHDVAGKLPVGRTFFAIDGDQLTYTVKLSKQHSATNDILALIDLGYKDVSIGGWSTDYQEVNGVLTHSEIILDHLAFVKKGALDDAKVSIVRSVVDVDAEILQKMRMRLELSRAV